jgi:hypothetical protein
VCVCVCITGDGRRGKGGAGELGAGQVALPGVCLHICQVVAGSRQGLYVCVWEGREGNGRVRVCVQLMCMWGREGGCGGGRGIAREKEYVCANPLPLSPASSFIHSLTHSLTHAHARACALPLERYTYAHAHRLTPDCVLHVIPGR